MNDYVSFPKGFLWGAATAAYQIEGAANEDGRGPSVWDGFCKMPGRIKSDDNGDVAIDHYHRYKEDVQLMKDLGLKAYRFSIAWPRVLPKGRGTPNEKGLDFYDRLIDELLAAGIQPWATLYHWDLPQALEDDFGGWLSQETSKSFGEYAALVASRYSDRVKHYMTVNEFGAISMCGYSPEPCNPPLKVCSKAEASMATHNLLLGHGLAVQALRANAKGPVQIGVAQNVGARIPASATPENIAAARWLTRYRELAVSAPILEGKYDPLFLQEQGENAPKHTDAEMKIIGSPLDFFGLNIYAPACFVVADPSWPHGVRPISIPKAYPRMHLNWINVGPEALYWVPRFCQELWNVKAIYITENGCCCDDRMNFKGEVDDIDRVMYLRNYISAACRAVHEGVPLKGYFAWSLCDNFEWRDGYAYRFGLHYVNYKTQKRTPKLSAKFYKEVVANNAVM